MSEPATASLLTCPHCGHGEWEIMPPDACLFIHECRRCKALLSPLPGDCCVFCSYGSVKCPPMQGNAAGCGDSTETTHR